MNALVHHTMCKHIHLVASTQAEAQDTSKRTEPTFACSPLLQALKQKGQSRDINTVRERVQRTLSCKSPSVPVLKAYLQLRNISFQKKALADLYLLQYNQYFLSNILNKQKNKTPEAIQFHQEQTEKTNHKTWKTYCQTKGIN